MPPSPYAALKTASRKTFSRWQLYNNVREARVVCSGSDSPARSCAAHMGSVSHGATPVAERGLSRDPGSLPEAERAAWEGKCPSRGQTSGGGGGRGMGRTETDKVGAWREEAAKRDQTLLSSQCTHHELDRPGSALHFTESGRRQRGDCYQNVDHLLGVQSLN